MLPGFSIETKPLSDLEKQLLPVVVRGLSKKLGAVNAVSNKEICAGLLKTCNVQVSEARVRKIINHIRMHNMVPGLVANGCGYYVTNSISELREYDKSLEGRETAIHAIRMKLKEHIVSLEKQNQHSFNYK